MSWKLLRMSLQNSVQFVAISTVYDILLSKHLCIQELKYFFIQTDLILLQGTHCLEKWVHWKLPGYQLHTELLAYYVVSLARVSGRWLSYREKKPMIWDTLRRWRWAALSCSSLKVCQFSVLWRLLLPDFYSLAFLQRRLSLMHCLIQRLCFVISALDV